MQEQTGIPYLLIDGRFANTAAALRLTGEILGVPERGEQLAAYAEATFAEIDARAGQGAARRSGRGSTSPAARTAWRPGSRARSTPRSSSASAAINVADAGSDRQGIAQVQLEQVLAWNPDTIVTWDDRFYRDCAQPIRPGPASPRSGAAGSHLSPGLPFGWIDRPPSLNRLIGLKWLAGVFYPDQAPAGLAGRDAGVLPSVLPGRARRGPARPPARSGRRQGPLIHAAPSVLVPTLLVALAGAAIVALLTGPYPLSPGDIARALLAPARRRRRRSPAVDTVLFGVRLPRIGAALLVGAALAAAGATYQNLFRNPLVSPDILGVSAGAGLGAVLGIFLSLPVLAIQHSPSPAASPPWPWSIWWPPPCAAASPCSSWCWPAWSSARSPAR